MSRARASQLCKALLALVGLAVQYGRLTARSTATLPAFLPQDIRTAVKQLDVEPKLVRYMCCSKCSEVYDMATAPETCTFGATKASKACGELLWREWRGMWLPRRLYSTQSFVDWLTWFLAVPGIEAMLEKHCTHPKGDGREAHGLWDSVAWAELGHFLEPKDGSLCLVFAFFMDWFNPFLNKQAGKKVSVGAMMMAILNLPEDERWRDLFLFLAGLAPGPKEATTVNIINVLEILKDELLRLEKGVLIPTPSCPSGRLVRCRIIPIIADLVALRKVTGFGSHAARLLCSFCRLRKSDIGNLDPAFWEARTSLEVHLASNDWLAATTLAQQKAVLQKHSIRYSVMNNRERDAVRHTLVGAMHNMVEGVAQRHLRRVWGAGLDYSGKTSRAGPNLEVKAAPSAAASERMDVDDADDDDERDGIDAEVTPLDVEAELAELAEERRVAGEELDDLTAPRKRRRTGLKLWLDIDYVSAEDSDYAPDSDAEDDEDGREASARLAKERRGVMQIAPAELQALRQGIGDVILPSWVARPPSNLGEAAHGKLKADTLFVLFSVVVPFVFVMLWSGAAQRRRQMLANVMALVVSINIACSYSTSTEAADVFARDFKHYLESMLHLFPHAHLVPNHHLALHIPEQLRYWGPIMALSEWLYERMNGQLQRFKTNCHLGAVEPPLVRS